MTQKKITDLTVEEFTGLVRQIVMETICNLTPELDNAGGITGEIEDSPESADGSPTKQPRVLGLGKDKLTIISDDDDYLEDFKGYMPPEGFVNPNRGRWPRRLADVRAKRQKEAGVETDSPDAAENANKKPLKPGFWTGLLIIHEDDDSPGRP